MHCSGRNRKAGLIEEFVGLEMPVAHNYLAPLWRLGQNQPTLMLKFGSIKMASARHVTSMATSQLEFFYLAHVRCCLALVLWTSSSLLRGRARARTGRRDDIYMFYTDIYLFVLHH